MIITRKQELRNTQEQICTVRSLDLMNWLCHKGFSVVKVLDNDKNPQFKIFLFPESKEIRSAIGNYLSEREV